MSLISSTNQEVPYLSEQVFNCSRASVHCHSPHIQTLLLQINQRGNMDMQGATATMWSSRLSRAILCSDINTAFSVWKTFWGFRKAIFQPARWALVSGKQKILYRTLNNRRHTRGKKKLRTGEPIGLAQNAVQFVGLFILVATTLHLSFVLMSQTTFWH